MCPDPSRLAACSPSQAATTSTDGTKQGVLGEDRAASHPLLRLADRWFGGSGMSGKLGTSNYYSYVRFFNCLSGQASQTIMDTIRVQARSPPWCQQLNIKLENSVGGDDTAGAPDDRGRSGLPSVSSSREHPIWMKATVPIMCLTWNHRPAPRG